jgi:hypothetical protein
LFYRAGGFGCLVANNTEEAPFVMISSDPLTMIGSKFVPRASIPSGMISLSDFDRILHAAQTGQLTVAGPIPAAELQAFIQVCI